MNLFQDEAIASWERLYTEAYDDPVATEDLVKDLIWEVMSQGHLSEAFMDSHKLEHSSGAILASAVNAASFGYTYGDLMVMDMERARAEREALASWLGMAVAAASQTGYYNNLTTVPSDYRLRLGAAPREAIPLVKGSGIWKDDILSTTAATNLKMYRVWGGESGQIGSWLTPVKPTSALGARSSLALPPQNAAQFFSEVTVPAGSRFQIGTAGAGFGQAGGGIQVQLLENIPKANFGPGVFLP